MQGWAGLGSVAGCSGSTLPTREASVVGGGEEGPVLVFPPRLVYLCMKK